MAVMRELVTRVARHRPRPGHASLSAWAASLAASTDPGFPSLERIVGTITARQPEPPTTLVVLTGLFALTMVVGWKAGTHLVTVGHEGGHALVAALLGAGVAGVTISSKGGGATESRRVASPFLVAFAGNVGPPLFGLGGAALLAADHVAAALWIGVGLLVALLLSIRNLFGGVVVALAGLFLFAVVGYGTPEAQTVVAHVVVWFLLLAGFPDLVKFHMARVKGSDYQIMRNLTWIPGLVWMLLQLAVAGVMFVYGARMLLDL